MQTPSHGDSLEQKVQNLLVNIDSEGIVSIGNGRSALILDDQMADRELPGLDQYLATQKLSVSALNSTLSVSLSAHEDCPYQRLVSVVSLLGAHEVENVNILAPQTTN